MRRNAFTLVEFVVVVAMLLILAAILFPVFQRGHDGGSNRSGCQSNLKQIGLASKQYLQDTDEHYPSLRTAQGWRIAYAFYLKNEDVLQCPTEGNATPSTSDYWFNARLSGVSEQTLEAAALTILSGDGYATADPRVAFDHLPQSWLIDPKSPAKRHLDGMNFVFADGHAKWLRPEKISSNSTRKGGTTFAIQ